MPEGDELWSAEYQYRPAKDWPAVIEPRRTRDSLQKALMEAVARMQEVNKTRPRDFRYGDVLTFDVYHPLTMMLMESHTSMVMTCNHKFVWIEAGRFDWGQMDVKEIIYAVL